MTLEEIRVGQKLVWSRYGTNVPCEVLERRDVSHRVKIKILGKFHRGKETNMRITQTIVNPETLHRVEP